MTLDTPDSTVDVVVVGAGAAGLATAIFCCRANAARSVRLLDGARKPGAKILVSGGSRCNVTNVSVSDADFWGGRPGTVRRVLRGFPVPATIAFFRDIGVPLHEEADGKLFPDSNRSRDVLQALLDEVGRSGVQLRADHRVFSLDRTGEGFAVTTTHGVVRARRVVLATGGMSLPKTGSDGAGLDLARRLGHSLVPTTAALVPLLLEGDLHRELQGVAQDAEIAVWIDGEVALRLTGAMLWTHFGVSGPVVLNASRHWLRAQLEERPVRLTANFARGEPFERVETRWAAAVRDRPRATVLNMLGADSPAAFAAAMLRRVEIDAATPLAQLTREARRRLVHALTAFELPVTGSRGYAYAEMTAGGVSLTEIDPATMASRVCPGLYLVGEMLDVDGRIGGFNFQWAWSSGYVAGRAIARD